MPDATIEFRQDAIPGVVFCVFAAIEFGKSRRRRARWLAHAQTLPLAGKTMRLRVEDGVLAQQDASERDARTGMVVDTPNGYLSGCTHRVRGVGIQRSRPRIRPSTFPIAAFDRRCLVPSFAP